MPAPVYGETAPHPKLADSLQEVVITPYPRVIYG
jgi:hypothetical protein